RNRLLQVRHALLEAKHSDGGAVEYVGFEHGRNNSWRVTLLPFLSRAGIYRDLMSAMKNEQARKRVKEFDFYAPIEKGDHRPLRGNDIGNRRYPERTSTRNQ